MVDELIEQVTYSGPSFHRSFIFLPASVIDDHNNPLTDYYLRCASGKLPEEYKADAFILDLEDSVGPSSRRKACDAARKFLDEKTAMRLPTLFLRITGSDDLREEEEELTAKEQITGVIIPKVEPDNFERRVVPFERFRKPIIPIIETAKAFLSKHELLKEIRRVFPSSSCSYAVLGRDDLSSSLRVNRDHLGVHTFPYLFLDFVIACRAAGFDPVGPVFNKVSDTEELIAEIDSLRKLGYVGCLCVFPSQVRYLNHTFSVAKKEKEKYLLIREKLLLAASQGIGWIIHEEQKYDLADLLYCEFIISSHFRGGP